MKQFLNTNTRLAACFLLTTTAATQFHVVAAPKMKTAQKTSALTMIAPLPSQKFAAWGEDSLAAIRRDLWMPERNLYADKVKIGQKPRDPAFMWGVGVQLSALTAAAEFEPQKYREQMTNYTNAIDVYLNKTTVVVPEGIIGYDVLPAPKPTDLYYDDNQWIVLDLVEGYETTGDAKFLERAEKTFAYVMSGYDDKLGGGIYWKENELSSKNTCSNAPAMTAALRLYQVTKKPVYLMTARRLYNWTCDKLQDSDGLFWDNIKLDGRVDKAKFSYNSALMIRANTLFYEITGAQKHLDEAQRIAKAAKAKWVRDDGSMDDTGRFAHLLLGSFLELGEQTGDKQWLETAQSVMTYAHEKLRDPNGHYPENWRKPQVGALETVAIIDSASVARAYWELALALREAGL